MTATPRLDVVIVTWNHGADVDTCLRSLAASSADAAAVAAIAVVDNASDVPYDAHDLGGLPPVRVLCNRRNAGFAPACNQGAAHGRAEFVLFLNPDTVVPAGALTRALAAFEDADAAHVGLLGLGLVGLDGVTQRTCGRFPTVRRILCQVTGLSQLAPSHWLGLRLTDRDHQAARDVDFVSGACLFARRRLFDRLGGFNEGFTLYLEDADLAWRAHQAGWRTRFLPHPPIRHRLGWSTGRDRPLRLAHSWRSLMVYAQRHFDPPRALSVIVITLVLAPIARLAQAAVNRSLRDARSAASATLTLGRLLWLDWRRGRVRLLPRAQPVSSTGAAPPRGGA